MTAASSEFPYCYGADECLQVGLIINHELGNAKVGYLQSAVLIDQDVFWFEVAVDDSFRVEIIDARHNVHEKREN